MRTIFTTSDIKYFLEDTFKSSSEKIILQDGEEKKTVDMWDYLNIELYAYKDRLVETSKDDTLTLWEYNDFVNQLNFSLDKSYGLVEITDQEVVSSQDIDNATIVGKLTMLIQTNKINNLEWFLAKLRNEKLGNPFSFKNSNGETRTCYLLLGTLIYDEEPSTIQTGECIVASLNFRLTYLNDAFGYSDTKLSFSFDGKDGNYMTVPITKGTISTMFNLASVPMQERPENTGFIGSSAVKTVNLTFYDYNQPLTNKINDIFWRTCSIESTVGDTEDIAPTNKQPVSNTLWLKVVFNGKTYLFKEIIDNIVKDLINGDYNTTTIFLRSFAEKE